MGPMADARSIVIINAHGIVQVANHAASALTGFASIDLIGRNVNGAFRTVHYGIEVGWSFRELSCIAIMSCLIYVCRLVCWSPCSCTQLQNGTLIDHHVCV